MQMGLSIVVTKISIQKAIKLSSNYPQLSLEMAFRSGLGSSDNRATLSRWIVERAI